jgi:hypothetical protein
MTWAELYIMRAAGINNCKAAQLKPRCAESPKGASSCHTTAQSGLLFTLLTSIE